MVAVAAASFWLWRGLAPAAMPSGILYANGHVEGTPVDVSTEVTARVLSTAFEDGDAVGAGDVLAKLDDALLTARLAQARGELERRMGGETAIRTPAADARLRVWYNPDQTNTSFIVLSMVALAPLMVGIIPPAARQACRSRFHGGIQGLENSTRGRSCSMSSPGSVTTRTPRNAVRSLRSTVVQRRDRTPRSHDVAERGIRLGHPLRQGRCRRTPARVSSVGPELRQEWRTARAPRTATG